MQTLAPQDLALISGGFYDDSFYDDDDDDDESPNVALLKDSFMLATEGSTLIDNHIENPYFRTALKIGLYSAVLLFDASVIISTITGDDDEW